MTASIGNTVRAELIKLTAPRSWWIATGLALVLGGGLSILVGVTGRALLAEGDGGAVDYLRGGVMSLAHVQIAIIVVGGLAGGSEYRTPIRLALLATPRRGRWFLAKTIAVVTLLTVVATVVVLVCCLAAELGLGDQGTWAWVEARSLLGGIGYLVSMGTLSFALGLACRTAIVPLALLIVLSQAGSMLLTRTPLLPVVRYLPDVAGMAVLDFTGMDIDPLPPGTGSSVLLGWVALALTIAGTAVRRREA